MMTGFADKNKILIRSPFWGPDSYRGGGGL